MLVNPEYIHSEKQSIFKFRPLAHREILWFTFMVSFVFCSSLALAAQQKENNAKITVKKIICKIGRESEKVIIDLDRATIPIVFDINGNNPRIVIDIMNVLPCRGRYRTLVNGKLIKQIRAYYHKDSEKLRVVLDLNLNPDRDYILSQFRGSPKFLIELKPYKDTTIE